MISPEMGFRRVRTILSRGIRNIDQDIRAPRTRLTVRAKFRWHQKLGAAVRSCRVDLESHFEQLVEGKVKLSNSEFSGDDALRSTRALVRGAGSIALASGTVGAVAVGKMIEHGKMDNLVALGSSAVVASIFATIAFFGNDRQYRGFKTIKSLAKEKLRISRDVKLNDSQKEHNRDVLNHLMRTLNEIETRNNAQMAVFGQALQRTKKLG